MKTILSMLALLASAVAAQDHHQQKIAISKTATGEIELRFYLPESRVVELQQSADLATWITAQTFSAGALRQASVTFPPQQIGQRFMRLHYP